MTGLFTLGLIVAVVLLWKRVRRLEARIDALGELTGLATSAAATPATVKEPATAKTEVAPSAMATEATDAGTAAEGPWSATAAPPPSAETAPPTAPVRKIVTLTAPSRPAPESVASGDAAPEKPSVRRGLDFEELFGSRLPIWAGGITLAVAGLFIVKYSIDTGLLSPMVRVLLGLLFAFALVAGAEVARRWSATAIDPRVAQALGGAGVAAAYADILIATNLYHLVPPWVGFVGLAITTLAALGLALRFGAPSALLALVGGLAAPALVGEQGAALAPLTLYLSLVVAGLAAVAQRQRWPWLTAAALVGGFGWGVVLIALMRLDSGDGVVLGGYVLLLGLAVPVLAGGLAHGEKLRLGSALIAMIQLAMIVSTGGYALLNWGLYALLALAVQWLAYRDPRLGWLPLAALAIGLLMLLGWPRPPLFDVTVVAAGAVLLFAPIALWRFADRRDPVVASLALGGTLGAAAYAAPDLFDMVQWGWAAILLSLPLLWRAQDRPALFLLPAVVATIMLASGVALLFLPVWRPLALALLLVVTVEAWRRRPELEGRPLLLVVLIATLIAQIGWLGDWLGHVVATLFARPLFVDDVAEPVDALRIFIAPALLLGLGWWRAGARIPRAVGLWPVQLGGIGLFALYKQLFGISGTSDFLMRGFAERVLFDALLFGAAWIAATRMRHLLAATLLVLALGRVLAYDMLIFNPLWRNQLVGSLPVANLLAPAFLLPVFMLWRAEPLVPAKVRRGIAPLQIGFVLMYAATAIRQLFHGSLIAVGGVGQGEGFAYSAVAILLALAFLGWGIRRADRFWRLASLVLMLVAIGKVFLVDAAALDGLLRIASFVGLGFSLIGIGWLYSRHLGAAEP